MINNQNNKAAENKMTEITVNGNSLKITGSLDYSSASTLLKKSTHLLKSLFKTEETAINFDCSGVTWIDSAGIALFIEWKRVCDNNNKQFSIINLPVQAKSLVETYRLKDLLHNDVS